MTAENETEESITPDADLEEESQDSIEGETAAEEEGEKGTDEPADTENGNSEGDEGRDLSPLFGVGRAVSREKMGKKMAVSEVLRSILREN